MYAAIGHAVRLLAARCDGAAKEDMVGFNRYDARFGHDLANLAEEQWNPQQARSAWQMLRKYKRQLATVGVDYDAIVEPTRPQVREITLRGSDVVIQCQPYSAAIKDDIKDSIPGRSFERDTLMWVAPFTPDVVDPLKGLAARWDFEIKLDLDQPLTVQAQHTAPVQPETRRVVVEGSKLAVHFPYDPELVTAVKGILGRKFKKDPNRWLIPTNPKALLALEAFAKQHGFAVDADIAGMTKAATDEIEWSREASHAEDGELDLPGLGGTLLPFQRAGVLYGLRKKRFLCADHMGLGKTVTALAVAWGGDVWPLLVVCPSVVKGSWERHAKQWCPGKTVAVIEGIGQPIPEVDVVIINWDLLGINPNIKHECLECRTMTQINRYDKRKGRLACYNCVPKAEPEHGIVTTYEQSLAAYGFRGVVMDEMHKAKNHKAQRTKALKKIVRGIEWRIGLTGTPVLNRATELITPLTLLGRLDDLGGFWKFMEHAGMERGRFGLEPRTESRADRNTRLCNLNQLLREACMIRRKKEDVLKELPAKRRAVVPIAITNRREYDAVLNELYEQLSDQPGGHLVKIEQLKAAAARGKLVGVIDWVRDFLESDEKLVLFAHHVDIQKQLADAFPDAVVFAGGMSKAARDAAEERFRTDPKARLAICSLMSAGVGITLTAASNVAIMEMGWTPGDHDQAEDRCHRIGQIGSVTAWYLLAAQTIDEKIVRLVDGKRAESDAITDGMETDKEASIYNDLVAAIKAQQLQVA